ncbi:MAG: hypothetical protein DHS20C06_10630 [Hyphobacterium sp.]|nr:MAG: hypothetical protein DHS20C06_10630 [Hyphobacterium sp.]
MTSLIDEMTRLITKQGLNVRAEGENVRIARAATQAIIPTGSVPPDTATDEHLLVRALTVITAYEDCEDFLDWCDEFGYDPADAARLDEFKAIGAGIANFQTLIGAERLSKLGMALRIGQAIDMARPR